MGRRYYVVYENGQWKVMLEQGPTLETFDTKAPAVKRAKELGRNNNRAVMVNFQDGRTGQDYFDYKDK